MRLSLYKDLSLKITHPSQERLTTSPGSNTPLLFLNSGVGPFTSNKNQISEKYCETGTVDFRVESVTVCRCHNKGSTFFSVI